LERERGGGFREVQERDEEERRRRRRFVIIEAAHEKVTLTAVSATAYRHT
jgi:hypothetical protein